ncbi:MAG: ABC transporter ATP-binding protein [Archangium sp.]|nr:ABC transporter ATP-binding protein [Archangium sp.]MDP3156846.1 ABC transporter ATP-binding protein [Archangium sp.]MDP3569694.1 ABC transporter ATP-binding protein [Archangium sp.]
MNDLAIELRGLTKTYGTGALAFQALKGIDLQVKTGEFMMLVGPSGSGKTTLLSILGCVLSPTEGEAVLFGEKLHGRKESELPDLRLSYIGFIFQGNNLIPALSVEDNVAFPLELRGASRKQALIEARDVLSAVGLSDKMKRHPNDLSGGQRQRVAVARAVAGRPPLILADEPTASLDAHTGQQVTELLKKLSTERGHTVVVVTHDNRIFHFADRTVHMEDGLLVPAPAQP